MQSGYGVPELQQFMVDGCSTTASLLPISYDMNAAAAAVAPPMQLQQQHGGHFFRPPAQSPHFFVHHQFHGFPFSGGPTHNHHQQQQRRMHPELGVGYNQDAGGFESSAGGSPPPKIICGQLGVAPPRFVATNFSLAVREAAAAGEEAGLNGDDAVPGGGSDSRAFPRWHQQQAREEVEEEEVEAAIKEPFWKRLDNMEYMSRNGKTKEKTSIEGLTKAGNQILNEEGKTSGSNYGFFSELEAIYSNRSSNGGSGGSNQAGSGSALTGDNTANPAGAGPVGGVGAGADHESETSAGEEASRKKLQKSRRKSRQRQLSSIAGFFQGLEKQLMDHQESLHCKFLEVMERVERERVEREETWRRQESARINEEAAARVREQTLASSREAAIISYLEKISGESLQLPSKIKSTHNLHNYNNNNNHNHTSTPAMDNVNNAIEATNQEKSTSSTQYVEPMMMSGGRRWPKSEVQALIRVRSGLENKFQEPGLKAPLWDEVSSSMAGLGYHRSAKRCKEKWENINKYFRKTKESAKKRPRHSKTCPYFHQLDQLYSKSQHKPSSFSANPSDDHDQDMPTANAAAMDNSDLLGAIVVTSEQAASMHSTPQVGSFAQDHSFDYSDQVGSSLQLDDNFNETAVNKLNARQVLLQLQEDLGNEDDDEEVQDDGNVDQDGDGDEELGPDH